MTGHWRPVRPWQHWWFAATVTVCWIARRHFPKLNRRLGRHDVYTCRICGSNLAKPRSPA